MAQNEDKMLEKKVEKAFVDRAKALGGLCIKFVSPSMTGVPDRIVLLNGRVYFVELKRPNGGRLSPRQKYVHGLFAKCGIKVHCVWNLEDVEDFYGKRIIV